MQTCLINLTRLDPPTNGGAARAARTLSRRLAAHERAGRLRLVFAVRAAFAREFPAWIDHPDALVLPTRDGTPGVLALGLTPDLVISPLFGGDPFDDLAADAGIPHIVRMPDAFALDRPDGLSAAELEDRRRVYAGMTRATAVVTGSEHARARLLHHLDLRPEDVHVIPNAVTETLLGVQPAPAGLHPFVLYPARRWPHKRHDHLVEVMREIRRTRPDVRLVLTGDADGPTRNGADGDAIVDLGQVTDAELGALYRGAEALLFASDYEGFGMPVIEALALGCPVLSCPLGPLPDIAGDAVLWIEDDTPAGWAAAFLERLPIRRDELVRRGRDRAAPYRWDRSGEHWDERLAAAGLELAAPGSPRPEGDADLRLAVREVMAWADTAVDLQGVADERLALIDELTAAMAEARSRIERLRREP